MPENRNMWEEGLQKRVVHCRDSNTARLIETLGLEVKRRISPPDVSLSCLCIQCGRSAAFVLHAQLMQRS